MNKAYVQQGLPKGKKKGTSQKKWLVPDGTLYGTVFESIIPLYRMPNPLCKKEALNKEFLITEFQ